MTFDNLAFLCFGIIIGMIIEYIIPSRRRRRARTELQTSDVTQSTNQKAKNNDL